MTLVYGTSLPSTYHSAQMLCFFVESQSEPVSCPDEAAVRAWEILLDR
jgi:hypothetical protein